MSEDRTYNCGFALYGPPAICTCGTCDDPIRLHADIASLQAHIGVLTQHLGDLISNVESGSYESTGLCIEQCRKALSTPVSDVLLSARREGAEAAAKVIADHKQKQRATRIPNSASAYDTWLDYTCGQLEAEIRALYPEVAPHQEKETR